MACGKGAALAVGIAVGAVNESGFSFGSTGRAPEQLRLKPLRRSRPLRRAAFGTKPLTEFGGGLVIGFSATLGIAVASAVQFTDLGEIDPADPGFLRVLADLLAMGTTGGFAVGAVFGLVHATMSAIGEDHDLSANSPWKLLSLDRIATLARSALTVLFTVLAIWFVFTLPLGHAVALPGGFAGVLSSALAGGLAYAALSGIARTTLSAWGNWLLFARLWLPLTGRLPWRPKRFLEDAYERGVLRCSGAVYQFRHARLRDHLADRPSR